MRLLPRRALVLALCIGLAACNTLTPYSADVRQGNNVTPQMVAQLKLGMTREQVRFIMGTPLLVDAFHTDRWDYVYRFQVARKLVEQRRIAVFFQNDKLARIEGDLAAAASPAPLRLPAPAATDAAPAAAPAPATSAPAAAKPK